MNLTALLAIVGLSAVGYLTGKTGVKVGTRVENRRRTAVRLATWCAANGLPDLASLLTSYAVQDYSGVLHQFQEISDKVSDPGAAQNAVDRFLEVQLSNKLKTKEGQEVLIKFIEGSLNIEIDREAIKQPAPALVRKEG